MSGKAAGKPLRPTGDYSARRNAGPWAERVRALLYPLQSGAVWPRWLRSAS